MQNKLSVSGAAPRKLPASGINNRRGARAAQKVSINVRVYNFFHPTYTERGAKLNKQPENNDGSRDKSFLLLNAIKNF
jgi:hypothetical protein